MTFLEMSYRAICKAVNVLSAKCNNIAIPIKNNTHYDLIVDAEGIISRIKVIQTTYKNDAGYYIANIGKNDTDLAWNNFCEFFFVESPEGCYLIPSIEVTQKRSMSLHVYEQYLIKLPSDTESDRGS